MKSNLSNKKPELEIIFNEPDCSFRLHQHDYPSPFAKWNYHPEYELHLITDSQGTMYLGDCIEEFTPGNLCLIGPNIPHNWMSHLRTRNYVEGRDVALQFTRASIGLNSNVRPREFSEIVSLLDDSHSGLVFEGEHKEEAIKLLLELRSLRGLDAFGTFLKLLSLLAQKCDARKVVSPNYQPNLDVSALLSLQGIFTEISEQLNGDIRMSRFAHQFGMSETAFSRFFLKNTGMNFSNYVRKIRVGYACSLLLETEMKIVDVAGEAGFQNLSLFNRQFKNETGKTPQEYRKLTRLL